MEKAKKIKLNKCAFSDTFSAKCAFQREKNTVIIIVLYYCLFFYYHCIKIVRTCR